MRFLIALVLFILPFVYAFEVEPNWIEVTHHELPIDVGRRIRVMHLTDLHIRQFGFREQRVVEIAQEEKPDLIVITGDHVSDEPNLDATVELISKLKAPLGVLVTWGNWEHWRPTDLETRLNQLPGVRVLINQSAEVLPGLSVIGLDDKLGGKQGESQAFERVTDGGKRIVLFHSPGAFDDIKRPFDLALAGHTHGGQVRIPFIDPIWLPADSGDYVAGWYERGGRKLYVSRGVGNSILQVRMFCRPEIAVIDLEPKK